MFLNLLLVFFFWVKTISCVVYEERKCSRFCRDADWNGAFNFSNNLDFVTNCVKQIKGISSSS